MGANDISTRVFQPPMAVNVARTAGWRLVNFTTSTVQPHPDLQHLKQHDDPKPGWSAVQHDFERRLSRFGIKVSETRDKSGASNSEERIPIVSAPVDTHAMTDGHRRQTMTRSIAGLTTKMEDYPLFEAPTMASFANNRKESRLEAAERQLRQALAEAQIWRDKYEVREHDLRASCRETMEWRLKYEDLYSTVLQDRDLSPQEFFERRKDTKSLG